MNKIKHFAISVPFLFLMMVSLFGQVPLTRAQTIQGWSEPVNLSFSGVATNPLLVVDFRGVLHAIWIDGVDEAYKYSTSSDGVTWSAPKTVNFPFSIKDPPPVFISDPRGAIHVFWINKIEESLFYGQIIPSNFDKPSEWSVRSRLARGVSGFDVLLDKIGILHLAFARNVTQGGALPGIYYRQSSVGGASWSEPVTLYLSEYFRSIKPEDVYIRLASSSEVSPSNLYVAWDNRPQKRIFMAKSTDGGLSWSEAEQMKGPEDTGGFDSPFNITVAAAEDRVLLIWQVGQPGSPKCTVYSQWSTDAGVSWGEPTTVLGGRSECPLSIQTILNDGTYFAFRMNYAVNPTFIAWNGERWSEQQTQLQLPTFSNPLTFETILLGCRQDYIYNNRLLVIGCDQGTGGDVWFISRDLDPVENWFSPPSVWGVPESLVKEVDRKVSLLSAVADRNGNLHLFWARSSGDDTSADIRYARWDGREWTPPDAVITGLGSAPARLSAELGAFDRLLLAWEDGKSGDLLFSWANAEKASLSSEWSTPTVLPSLSASNSSPDVLSDASGRIVVAYAVPINEERGIYVVQSTDDGTLWSAPVRVFDAVSAQWEMVDQPKLALSRDGVLHLLFSRLTIRGDQGGGLYYTQSRDGGFTWSEPEVVSEAAILWSEILNFDDGTLHRIWQEYDGLVYANLDQVSHDGGRTWSKSLSVTGVNDRPTAVAIAWDPIGRMHFMQLIQQVDVSVIHQNKLTLQDWEWNGSTWELHSTGDFIVRGDGIEYDLTAGITSKGLLEASVAARYTDAQGEEINEILTFNRFLGNTSVTPEPFTAQLPTPPLFTDATEVAQVEPTVPVDLSVLYDDNVSISSTQRNLLGVLLIGGAMVVTVFLLLRGGKRK
ncbi:MAG TPA: sialidase family protein [Anaerolineales bacterium]|nr:sialidase family protein [Anaerolineales bacterium]